MSDPDDDTLEEDYSDNWNNDPYPDFQPSWEEQMAELSPNERTIVENYIEHG